MEVHSNRTWNHHQQHWACTGYIDVYNGGFLIISVSVQHMTQWAHDVGLVCWSLMSQLETMPAREINLFTALTRIRSQFLRTQ